MEASFFEHLCISFQLSPGKKHQAIDISVSPEDAERLISENNYKHQRPRNRKHIERLAISIKNGDFREFTPIDFAVLDGLPILVNGQHTLSAITAAGVPYSLSFHLHKVNNEAEVDSLYAKYDNGRSRTMRDVLGTVGEELQMDLKERNALSAAVALIDRGLRVTGGNSSASLHYMIRNADHRKVLMREWQAEARQLFRQLEGTTNKKLFYKTNVLAVALVTTRHQPQKAAEFWAVSSNDNGLFLGDPRKTLVNWLMANLIMRDTGRMIDATIACWNAWFKEVPLVKVHTGSSSTEKILGTTVDRNYRKS